MIRSEGWGVKFDTILCTRLKRPNIPNFCRKNDFHTYINRRAFILLLHLYIQISNKLNHTHVFAAPLFLPQSTNSNFL